MSNAGPGLALVGIEQRLWRWLVMYGIAVLGLVCFLIGDLVDTIVLILVAEVFLLLVRPKPALAASAFRPPAPTEWQAPIAAARWVELARGFQNLAGMAVVLGLASIALVIILAVVAVRSWPYHLGAGNFVVLGVLGAWLVSRQFWITPLRAALKGNATVRLSQFLASMSVTGDGVLVDLRPINIGRLRATQQVFLVPYAELDVVRAMDALAAQGYQAAMEQYDPTLVARASWEVFRFLSGQIARPTLCIGVVGLGTHVLMRSATLLYLIGNADQTAPAIVTAWQAWQTAHRMPATPAG